MFNGLFISRTDFDSWKLAIEHQTNSFFYSKSRYKDKDGRMKLNFICNRSGIPDTKNKGKSTNKKTRQPKAQGSCKIGRLCPARIICILEEGQFIVTFVSSHHGHELDPAHVGLTGQLYEEIARDLAKGVPKERVCRDVGEKRTPSKKDHRYNLITKKDIDNIANKFQLNEDGRYHEDDVLSVDIFIKEQQEKVDEKNVIFTMYKKQGVEGFPGLQKDDFLLAFMTPFQKAMIEELKNKTSVVMCMDATHETNGYGFYLITLLTKDKHGEGLPLAHMFSTHEDLTSLKYFLKSIRQECGKILCNCFMTDDAPQYFQAWSSVMVDKDDVSPSKLLCAWHVTRSFERNILSKLKGHKLKEFVFHHLKTIMAELDEQKLETMLHQFCTTIQLDDNTKKFSVYFEREYVPRIKEWCYCYRKGLGINTNMAIESMHRIIKTNYFKGRVVKRLDKALSLLLLYLQDKKRDHLIKSYKGKITRKNTIIFNNHKRASRNISKFTIDAGNAEGIDIYVLRNEDEIYTVTIKKEECPNEPCGLKYKDCDICIDLINCTCFDRSIHFEMCQHCHIVMLYRLCTSSSIIETEARQHPLPTLAINDIEDHFECDVSVENPESMDRSQVEQRPSNQIDFLIGQLEKRMAELVLKKEQIKKCQNEKSCSFAVKTIHRCTLTLQSHLEQMETKDLLQPAINPLAQVRKRKLGHQKRSFVRIRKKPKRSQNPLKNPSKKARKDIRGDYF